MKVKLFECRQCNASLPRTTEYFYKWKYRSDGLYFYCKKCCIIRSQKNKIKNRERYRELGRIGARRQRAANPIRFLIAKRRYYSNHRDRVNLYKREYRKRNPWQIKGEQNRRQARRRGATGTYSDVDIQSRFRSQNGKCFWCKVLLPIRFHIDHYIPISRGGTNGSENIVLSCAFCNCSRKDKLPSEWSPNK